MLDVVSEKWTYKFEGVNLKTLLLDDSDGQNAVESLRKKSDNIRLDGKLRYHKVL